MMISKSIIKIISVLFLVIAPQALVLADTISQPADAGVTVITIFSIEFYTDANVLYSTNLPFTITPNKSLCYPDGRAEYDGKSDTGIICRSNLTVPWYLKLSAVAGSSPAFPMQYFKYYMGQPYNRNTDPGQPTDGTLAHKPDWYTIAASPDLVYTSGSDYSNLPYGTLSTFCFAIDPQDLPGGKSYIVAITYTLTTTP